MSSEWGAVQSLSAAAARYYLSPHLWAPSLNTVYFDTPSVPGPRSGADHAPLDIGQSVAWLTGAVLLGGILNVGALPSELTAEQTAVLRRLLPAAARPARPLDLFVESNPRVWWLPVESSAGNWQVAALFNWDDSAPATLTLAFHAMGLTPGALYTVYDFWNDTYYGKARNSLDVSVAPGSVRLLALKKYENRPMWLTVNSHFTQGATDLEAVEWEDGRLSGRFIGAGETEYALRFLVPGSHEPTQATVAGEEVDWTLNGELLTIEHYSETTEPVDWAIRFDSGLEVNTPNE